MGERGLVYICPDLCFHFLFIEVAVYVTHLKEVCRLACYKHFIEWEMSCEESLNLAFGGLFYQNAYCYRSKRC